MDPIQPGLVWQTLANNRIIYSRLERSINAWIWPPPIDNNHHADYSQWLHVPPTTTQFCKQTFLVVIVIQNGPDQALYLFFWVCDTHNTHDTHTACREFNLNALIHNLSNITHDVRLLVCTTSHQTQSSINLHTCAIFIYHGSVNLPMRWSGNILISMVEERKKANV